MSIGPSVRPTCGSAIGWVVEATEALADPDPLLFDPDPKSRPGRGARLFGVLGHRQDGAGGDLGSSARSGWRGANGWRANATDQRVYREGNMGSSPDRVGLAVSLPG